MRQTGRSYARQQTQLSMVITMPHYSQAKLFIEILQPHSQGRDEIEAFLRVRYKKYYGASLKAFLPNMLCLRDENRKIMAALGFRIADDQPLFLEQYLSRPIESQLSHLAGSKQPRNRIVEVGNLASVSAGGNRWLITALTAFLKGEGADWVVFTAHRPLLNSFAQMGISIFTLQQAIPDFMSPQELSQWGSYYRHSPVIATGNVMNGYEVLQQRFRQEHAMNTFRLLLLNAHREGMKRRENHPIYL